MLAYLAILMTGLLLCCGLAVDVGLMQMHKLQMQSATDAAAFAAELEYERGTGNWATAGKGDAGINGFTDGTGSTTVNITMRPSTGTFSGWYDAIQATITQPQSSTFLKFLSNSTATLNTKSVALVTPCVYLTGTANTTTYQLATTSATISGNCPYYINDGASVDANSSFSVLAENITGPSSGSAWNNSGATPPRYNAKTMLDPLRNLVQPSAGSCAQTDVSATNQSASQTAYPATYCGNSVFTCTNTGVVVTLYPGLYVFAGSLTIDKCTFAGNGVMLFFTKDPSRGTWGKLSLTNSTVSLTAPSTTSGGALAGISVMTDRNTTTTSAQDFVMTSTTFYGDGIWYLTNVGMAVKSGYFVAPNYGGILADNLLVSNSTLSLQSNFSSLSGGNPFRPLGGLAE